MLLWSQQQLQERGGIAHFPQIRNLMTAELE